jgi:hypothetical protein
MQLFFSRRIPHLNRVLLVESGSRAILEQLLPRMRELYGAQMLPDLVTCYAGQPASLPPGSAVFRVSDYPGTDGRKRLTEELIRNRYDVIGIICSAEPIMTKWKWWLAAKIPAKLFVVNENGDHFWADHSNWRIIGHFMLFRAGLTGGEAIPQLARLFLFPFTLTYLLAYAAMVHLRRKAHL